MVVRVSPYDTCASPSVARSIDANTQVRVQLHKRIRGTCDFRAILAAISLKSRTRWTENDP